MKMQINFSADPRICIYIYIYIYTRGLAEKFIRNVTK